MKRAARNGERAADRCARGDDRPGARAPASRAWVADGAAVSVLRRAGASLKPRCVDRWGRDGVLDRRRVDLRGADGSPDGRTPGARGLPTARAVARPARAA